MNLGSFYLPEYVGYLKKFREDKWVWGLFYIHMLWRL
jgi:hypothetical protein